MTRLPASRRPRFSGRAAVLAVVFCAITLSLAYISQRRQIDQLLAMHQQLSAQLRQLQARQHQLANPAYIAQQARDRLHMCLPRQTCYVINNPQPAGLKAAARRAATPWYERLWASVQQADRAPAK